MPRGSDKPGTYRIKQRPDGTFRLSGVKTDGARVRIPNFPTRDAAMTTARTLFPDLAGDVSRISRTVDVIESLAHDWEHVDDWGMPSVSDKQVADIGKKLGLDKPTEASNDKPADAPKIEIKGEDTAKRKERQLKQAKSLMEMAGIAGAAGDVMFARKLCETANKEAVNPNPKQVNDLADSIRDTLTEWFGDRDIKPWQMMILLGLGIPMTMLIQSKPKPLPAKQESPQLSAVK